MNGRAWTEAEDQVLRARYPDELAANLVGPLGHPLTSVYQRARKLGIEKSQAFRSSEKSGQILRGRTNPAMVATQIQKGAKPWNKGIKGSCGNHPNCRATQFRKGELQGRAAKVVQPLGAERVTKDGILQRKVNNDMPFQRRWKSVHSLVWEAAHGPIPPGHKVVFLPGQNSSMAAQITPEKLELVTHGELMRRNSYHTRYPKELGLVIQMRGQLNRKINRLSKGELADEK
jgi:hypothetical protein